LKKGNKRDHESPKQEKKYGRDEGKKDEPYKKVKLDSRVFGYKK
jgi:hypothetical protein